MASTGTRQHHAGFSLTEALVALTMMGVLAAMLLPTLKQNVLIEKNLNITKAAITELAQAYVKYQKTQMPQATTAASDIINRMNYVRLISDSSLSVQVADATEPNPPCSSGSPCALYDSPCNATTPCALLQNGALVQYDADANFDGTAYNTNALKFVIDPDADGEEVATSVVMFFSGRMCTLRYAPMAAFDADDDLPVGPTDPDYIWPWTDG